MGREGFGTSDSIIWRSGTPLPCPAPSYFSSEKFLAGPRGARDLVVDGVPCLWWENDPETGAVTSHMAHEGAALSALWWQRSHRVGEERRGQGSGSGGCLGPTISLELNSRRKDCSWEHWLVP